MITGMEFDRYDITETEGTTFMVARGIESPTFSVSKGATAYEIGMSAVYEDGDNVTMRIGDGASFSFPGYDASGEPKVTVWDGEYMQLIEALRA